MVIQPEAFVFNHTLLIEVSILEYHNKDHNDESNQGKVKIYFHSHFRLLYSMTNDRVYGRYGALMQ